MKHQNVIDKNRRTRTKVAAEKNKPLYNQKHSMIQNQAAQEFSAGSTDTFNHTMAEMNNTNPPKKDLNANETSLSKTKAAAKKIAGQVGDAISNNKKMAIGGLAAVGVAVAAGLLVKNKGGVKNITKGAKKLLASSTKGLSTKKAVKSAKGLKASASKALAKKAKPAKKLLTKVTKAASKSTISKGKVKKVASKAKSAVKSRVRA